MTEEEDIVVSPLVQSLLDKLASDVLCYFGSEWNIQNELEDLSNTLENIQAMLGCLEMMQTMDLFLKCHLKNLRDVAYDTNVVLDEFIYEVHRGSLQHEKDQHKLKIQVCNYFPFSLNANRVLHQHEIAPFLNDLKEKLVQIQNNLKPHYSLGSSFKMEGRLITIQPEGTKQKSSSFIRKSHVVNRGKDVNVIKEILLLGDQNNSHGEVPVIAIIGMGGVGKTTLAQLVYNDSDVEKHFDLKAWVCVSNDFNVERLTEAILESTNREPCNLKNLEPLQGKLQAELRGKRFLLVLDDVWNENQTSWDALIDPLGFAEMGSRIITTTCSKTVLSTMNTIYCHDLQYLSDEDCWSVIKRRAFVGQNSSSFPNLEAIGRKIAKKCKGLPLAANILGGLLRSTLDENEWQDILKSNRWNNILPSLILSYHYLPPHLKQCFAYCSLFPEGHEFDREELIRMWMAEGFLPSKKVEIMEDIGNQYLDDLLSRYFFQHSNVHKSKIVMHGLILELATSVSGKQCVRIDDHSYVNSRRHVNILKEARHVSLFTDEINLVDLKLFGGNCLHTIILNRYRYDSLPHGLSQELRWLRVLTLKGTNIKILPDYIGKLKHLRYLDLSYTLLEGLPESICELYNLQTLNLQSTKLQWGLPLNTRNLVNLQHLMIDQDYDGATPSGIGRLIYLRTLPIFRVSGSRCLNELKELQHLQGELRIVDLHKALGGIEISREANLKNKPKLSKLRLEWSIFEHLSCFGVLEGLQPHTEIKELSIFNYQGSRFPNWMMLELLNYNKLVNVELMRCHRCDFLPPLGQLPLLQSLTIDEISNVKELGHEFYGRNGKPFQSLQFLSLEDMNDLRKWVGANEGEFPCLRKLRIRSCHKLRELPLFFPVVQDLHLSFCEDLTALPSLSTISKLHLTSCNDRILSDVHRCTSLSSLYISFFLDLTTLPLNMLVPLVESLETFEIYNCIKLSSLSDDVGLQHLASLKHLEICHCDNLASLPVGLHNLTSLRDLRIIGCPSLMSMPRGLNNLISLTHLTIGCHCEQLLSFLEGEEDNVPPKLTHFWIIECINLINLPNGLRHLSSLEEMHIMACPCLKVLPEDGFPTSLHLLHMEGISVDLKRRCDEGNADWPRIAHIPWRQIE